MQKNKDRFELGSYYHVYNRGNGGSLVFYRKENYHYFFKLFDKYLSQYLDLFAYCLLPNHFHLFVKVKHLDQFENIAELIGESFRRFFISYSQAINKQENRNGSLFQKHFKRIKVENEDYLSRIMLYIHLNPYKHGIYKDFESYTYSSYRSILSDKPTKLDRKLVLEWFGGRENFIKFHDQNRDIYQLEEFDIN